MASSSRTLSYWPRQVTDPSDGGDIDHDSIVTVTGASATDLGDETISSMAANTQTAADFGERPTSAAAPTSIAPPSALPSPTAAPTGHTADKKDDGGIKFHIAYLTPLFVIIGLVLIFAVGGRIWGRISYAREQAQLRRDRYERRMARSQRRAARSQAASSSSSAGGWRSYEEVDDEEQARTMIEKEDYLGDRDELGSGDEFDEDEDEVRKGGPLSALSSHIANRSARPLPPSSRARAGRYEAEVQSNSWFAVRWRRMTETWAAAGSDAYTAPPATSRGRSGDWQQGDSVPRAPMRGTWARIKQGLTGNVGWGYKGEAPTVNERRRLVAQAHQSQASGLWTQAPPRPPSSIDQDEKLPHLAGGSGLLLPPQLSDEGTPYVLGEAPEYERGRRPGRSIFPLSRFNERDRSYSPPSLRAPPNTFAALATSASRQGIASIREIFGAVTGSNSKASLGARPIDSTSRGAHHPLSSELGGGLDLQGVQVHTHQDGSSCALDGPQYLPPHSVLLARKDSSFKPAHSPVSLHDNEVFLEDGPAPKFGEEHAAQRMSTPPPFAGGHGRVAASASGRNVPSSGLGQAMRIRSVSSRSIAHDAGEDQSPQREEKREKIIIKRASTVRFALSPDRDESAATSFALDASHFAAETEEQPMEVDPEEPSPPPPPPPKRRLSRAQTTTSKGSARRRQLEEQGQGQEIKRFRSLQSSTTTMSDLSRRSSTKKQSSASPRKIMSPASIASSSRETPTPYTELVNFGDYEDEDAKEDAPRRASYGSSVPGLSSGGSSTGEDEEDQVRSPDMESEIDSVLLSVIARSNSSRSVAPFYHSDAEEKQSTPQRKRHAAEEEESTPLGRKRTWQRREDGRWARVSLDEEEWQEFQQQQQQQQGSMVSPTLSMRSDGTPRGFAMAAATHSPPPLPTPPPPTAALPRALRVASPSPTKRRGAASPGPASALGIHQAFDTPSVYSTASPASSTVSGATPRASNLDERILYSHGKTYSDLDLTSLRSSASSEKKRKKEGSTVSASSHGSASSQSTKRQRNREAGDIRMSRDGMVEDDDDDDEQEGSPTRRGAHRRPPRRYQARLAPEAPSESTEGGAPMKRTGKTLKTPAQKEKDNEFAMDRVQSMIAKAHAQRLAAQQLRQQEQP